MVAQKHDTRKHASISLSAMKRNINCPVSIVIGKRIDDDGGSDASKEGNLAHEVSEMFVEDKLKGLPYREVDEEVYDFDMRKFGKQRAERIYALVEPYLKLEHAWFIEKRLVISKELDIWGTGDFIFFFKKKEKVYVIVDDYKYGKWIAVESEDNWQLISYMYGAYMAIKDKDKVKEFLGIIDQPRVQEEVCERVYSLKELKEKYWPKIDEVGALVRKWENRGYLTDEDYEKYQNAGPWCQFCKVMPVCREYWNKQGVDPIELVRKLLNHYTMDELKDKGVLEMAYKKGIFSEAELTAIILNKTLFTELGNNANKIAYSFAMRGQEFKKLKLIETKPRRSLPKNTKRLIDFLRRKGVKNPVTIEERVMNITEIEKILGKGAIDDLLDLPTEKSYKLVSIDEKGDEVKLGLAMDMLFSEQAAKRKREMLEKRK